MKTILLTLIAILLNANTSFAQTQERVRNGDPGLALANAAELPQADMVTRLLAAFEKGSMPDLDLLDGSRNNEYWTGVQIGMEGNNLAPRDATLSVTKLDLGPLLNSNYKAIFDTEPKFTKSAFNAGITLNQTPNFGSVFLPEINVHLRMYLNNIIAVEYPLQNGSCRKNHEESIALLQKYNICTILYYYKKRRNN